MAFVVWISRKKPLELVEAILVDDISREVATAIEELWAEDRRRAKLRISSAGGPSPESLDWNWARKLEDAEQTPMQCFGLQCEHAYQGLMMLNLSRLPARLKDSSSILYVEYLEVAPWNQVAFVGDQARFSGVGSTLIWAAALVSKQKGLGGCLGLHSLPQARTFYLRLGFTDGGPDEAEEGLHYMELSAKPAAMLLKEEPA